MDIPSKVANLVLAVALTAMPASSKVIKALPYIQIAAASAVAVNNGIQIASRLNSEK